MLGGDVCVCCEGRLFSSARARCVSVAFLKRAPDGVLGGCGSERLLGREIGMRLLVRGRGEKKQQEGGGGRGEAAAAAAAREPALSPSSGLRPLPQAPERLVLSSLAQKRTAGSLQDTRAPAPQTPEPFLHARARRARPRKREANNHFRLAGSRRPNYARPRRAPRRARRARGGGRECDTRMQMVRQRRDQRLRPLGR